MRKYYPIVIALLLVIVGVVHFGVVQNGTNGAEEEEIPPIEYPDLGGPGDRKLYPIDEAIQNTDFEKFRDELVDAAQRRDLDFLKEHTDDNVRYTFGENDTIEGFLREWHLDSNPEESEFWGELIQVLELGGTFDGREGFTAPYVYSQFPEDIDAFQHVVIVDEKVKVYAQPDIKSEIQGTLTYSIVRLLEPDAQPRTEEGGSGLWLKVQTFSGHSGFILAKYARSPIGYRARWKNVNGTWRMVFFVAGD